MNLRFLRTFVAIADNAGFARAAARLNLTQSAASRQIQALEDELGLRLFVRIGRGVRLTREGEDLLVRSRQLLFDADALGQRASALKTGEVGVLRVGATPQVIESLLADFLLRYRKRHGGVEVHLVEDGGSRLPGRLARGDIDVALMPAGEDRFSSRLLYPMHVLAVVAQGHRLGRRSVLDVTELVDEPLLRLNSTFASHGWFEARLPGRAYSTPRAARKRGAADVNCTGPDRSWCCRGAVSSANSAYRCPGGGVGASRRVDRTMDCRCLGVAALLATLCCAIRRRVGRPLPAKLSGPRLQSARTATTAATREVTG